MKNHGLPIILIFLMSISGSAQQKKTRKMTGSAAKGPVSAGLKVAPDLDQRLAKFRRVRMPFNRTGLTAREQQMVRKLVEACGYLESIFWRQSDPEALALYQSLESSTNPRDVKLRTYLKLNASRFDLIDENKPFVGTDPMPPGRGFYFGRGAFPRPDSPGGYRAGAQRVARRARRPPGTGDRVPVVCQGRGGKMGAVPLPGCLRRGWTAASPMTSMSLE